MKNFWTLLTKSVGNHCFLISSFLIYDIMSIQKLLKKQPFAGKFTIVCGGSQGMGKESSKLIAKLGGNVCIVARRQEILSQASKEILESRQTETQFVETISCDTTDMDALKPLLTAMVEKHGVPDYLINAVGYAHPQYVEKFTLDDFKDNMNVNYYGQLVPILILLPYFMEAKKKPIHIANISSGFGFVGVMGYTTYCPSKFAVVGLTESLQNELKPYNISFSVMYPPDTQTPGFDTENSFKPPEVAMISEIGSIMTAEQVAEVFVKGILKKKSKIYPGLTHIYSILVRLFPKFMASFADSELKKARKKLGKSTNY